MNRNLLENRQIRVFISSTFRDMQDERNYLLIHTFPKLRRLAAERDVTLTELDLRWGISEEESKTGRVVEICLSEIDNCIPFFIGIIGYRYGWIPERNDVSDSANMQDRYRWVYDDIESKISVTEMEMQYGVLRRKEPTNAYFYIKSDGTTHPDIDYPDKLANLVASVEHNGRYPVCSYHSVEDLASTVEKDFIEMLDRLFPLDGLDQHEIERKKQQACIRQHMQSYVPNPEDLIKLDDFLAGDSDYLTVTGECGSGKSALLANWADRMSHDDRYYILYYSTGGDGENECEYWQKELRRLQILHGCSEEDGLSDDIARSDRPVILILDDVSKYIVSDNWQINTLTWLPVTKNGNKTILASSVSKYCLTEFRKTNMGVKEESMEVSPIPENNVRRIVHQYLKNYGKKLTDEQVEKISSFPLSCNAGILSTLLDVLVYYGSFETLEEFMESFLDASDKTDFYDRYLSHIESHFAQGLIENVLMMIALPLYGLKESEIKDCLHLRSLAWSQVYCLLSRSLCFNKGCIQIANMDLEKAITRRYQDHLTQHRRNLIDYLEKRLTDTQDEARKERCWDELLNQCHTLGQDYDFEDEMAEKTFRIISDPDVMWYLTTKRASKIVALNGEGRQIYKYWKWLRDVDPQKYSVTTYLDCGLSDRMFFYRSSDFCDIAAHARDTTAEAALAIRAIDLYRSGMRPEENEEQYFSSVLQSLSGAAYAWNLLKLRDNLRILHEKYMEYRVLPEMTEPERFMRALVSALTASDLNQAQSCFAEAVDIADSLGDDFRMDKAMALFKMAVECRSSMPEMSLQYINDAIDIADPEEATLECEYEEDTDQISEYDPDAEVKVSDDDYDDHTECVKAEMLGTRGLILKDLQRYEEAYDSVMAAIIRYEDIEDIRIEHGNFIATIDKVESWGWELDTLAEMIEDSEDDI